MSEKLLALCKEPKATTETIESLLKAGADIEARNKIGRTPLMFAAVGNKNPKMIESLLNPLPPPQHGQTAQKQQAQHGQFGDYQKQRTVKGLRINRK